MRGERARSGGRPSEARPNGPLQATAGGDVLYDAFFALAGFAAPFDSTSVAVIL